SDADITLRTEAQRRSASLESELARVQAELGTQAQSLKRERDAAIQGSQDSERKLSDTRSLLETKMGALREEVASLTKAKTAMDATQAHEADELARTKETLATTEAALADTKARLQEAQKAAEERAATLVRQHENKSRETAAVSDKRASQVAELRTEVTALLAQNSDLKNRVTATLQQAEASRVELGAQVQGVQQQLNQARLENQAKQADCERTERSLVLAREAADAHQASLRGEISNLRDALAASETALAQNQDDAAEAREGFEYRISSLEEQLRTAKTDASVAAEEYQQQRAEMGDRLSVLEVEMAENDESSRDTINMLETELDETREVVDEQKEAYAGLEEQLRGTRERLEQLKALLDNTQREAGDAGSAAAKKEQDLEKSVSTLSASLSAEKAERQKTAEALKGREQEVHQMSQNISSLVHERDRLVASLRNAEMSYAALQERTTAQLQDNTDEMTLSLGQMEAKLRRTRDALDAAHAEHQSVTDRLGINAVQLRAVSDERDVALDAERKATHQLNVATDALEQLRASSSEAALTAERQLNEAKAGAKDMQARLTKELDTARAALRESEAREGTLAQRLQTTEETLKRDLTTVEEELASARESHSVYVAEQENEEQSLRARLTDLERDVARLEQARDQAIDIAQKREAETVQCYSALDQMQGELADAEASAGEVQRKNKEAMQDADARLESLLREREALASEVVTVRTELEDLRVQVQTVSHEKDAWAESFQQKEASVQSIVADLKSQLAARSTQLSEVQAQRATLRTELSDVSAKMTETRTVTDAELENAAIMVAEAEAANRAAQDAAESLEAELARAKADAEEVRQERDALSEELVQTKSGMVGVQRELETQVAESGASHNQMRDRIVALTGELEQHEAEIGQLYAIKHDLEGAVDAGAGALQALREEADRTSQDKEERINALGEALSTTRASLDASSATIESLNGRVAELEAEAEEMGERVAVTVSNAETAVKQLEDACADKTSTQKQLSKHVAVLQESNAQFSTQLRQSQTLLSVVQQQRRQLQNSNKDLQQRLESTLSERATNSFISTGGPASPPPAGSSQRLGSVLSSIREEYALRIRTLRKEIDALSEENKTLNDNLKVSLGCSDSLRTDLMARIDMASADMPSNLSEEADLKREIAELKRQLSHSMASGDTSSLARSQAEGTTPTSAQVVRLKEDLREERRKRRDETAQYQAELRRVQQSVSVENQRLEAELKASRQKLTLSQSPSLARSSRSSALSTRRVELLESRLAALQRFTTKLRQFVNEKGLGHIAPQPELDAAVAMSPVVRPSATRTSPLNTRSTLRMSQHMPSSPTPQGAGQM
ncbi:hypothetical protein KIPB_004462, partial [Kipferlia bialata]